MKIIKSYLMSKDGSRGVPVLRVIKDSDDASIDKARDTVASLMVKNTALSEPAARFMPSTTPRIDRNAINQRRRDTVPPGWRDDSFIPGNNSRVREP